MNKVAHYLQEHLMGEVMDSVDARRYFSTDSSVLSIVPDIIVYPRNENDIRKIARFTWQLAERGRMVPITARGSGTDLSGAALGSGVILALPAHMNRIIELDDKSGQVMVEPGINYGKLQQTLVTHGRFLPPAPASMEYSTVGGAVGNNAAGDRSLKYGDTRLYTKGLRVVLANGEVITTTALNKRDLNKKLGLATFEGEIYRAIDTLLEENSKILSKMELNISKNSAGYDLLNVRSKSGFDLTPLFVGSQGTLGIISQITLDTLPYNPTCTTIVGFFDDIHSAAQTVAEIRALPDMPASLEMVDENLFELIDKSNPNLIKGIIERPFPKVTIIAEFDDSERTQKHMARKALRIIDKHSSAKSMAETEDQQNQYRKLRQAVSTLLNNPDGNAKALPFIDDGIVPIEKLAEFLDGIYVMLSRSGIKTAVWGHIGDANLRIQPNLDLSQVGDRQRFFKLYDEYYELVKSLGGSSTGEYGDGRLRGPVLSKIYDGEVYELFRKVKKIFDPYNTLNPGVKMEANLEDIKANLRQEYTFGPWFEHLPRT